MGLLRDYNIYSIEEAKKFGFEKAWFVWFSSIGQGNDFFAIHKNRRILGKLAKEVKELVLSDLEDIEKEEAFILLKNYYENKYKVEFFAESDVGRVWRWDRTGSVILAKGKFDNYYAFEYKRVSLY
ncbi:MAG: hypothetical protein QXG39_00120 [Candidatus Aenigmatarchaeota archaeon]